MNNNKIMGPASKLEFHQTIFKLWSYFKATGIQSVITAPHDLSLH